eukprot:scaffold1036_cov169-Ochromonas_danica.AAC.1
MKRRSSSLDYSLPSSSFKKGHWSIEDDEVIRQEVLTGNYKWSDIAKKLHSKRTGKQCRERWSNHLNPLLKKSPWTQDEDEQLIAAQAVLGNSWTKIAKTLEGRSENEVKNRWYSALAKRARTTTTTGHHNLNLHPPRLAEEMGSVRPSFPPSDPSPSFSTKQLDLSATTTADSLDSLGLDFFLRSNNTSPSSSYGLVNTLHTSTPPIAPPVEREMLFHLGEREGKADESSRSSDGETEISFSGELEGSLPVTKTSDDRCDSHDEQSLQSLLEKMDALLKNPVWLPLKQSEVGEGYVSIANVYLDLLQRANTISSSPAMHRMDHTTVNQRENPSNPLPREVKQAASCVVPSIPSHPLPQSHPLLVHHPWCDHALLVDHGYPVEASVYSTHHVPLHINTAAARGEVHSFYALDEASRSSSSYQEGIPSALPEGILSHSAEVVLVARNHIESAASSLTSSPTPKTEVTTQGGCVSSASSTMGWMDEVHRLLWSPPRTPPQENEAVESEGNGLPLAT